MSSTPHDKAQLKGQPLMQGPVFASTFHLSGDIETDGFQYGRFDHPNWQALEAELARLEGGKTLVFPSGMAAMAAVMTALLQAGDTVLLPSDGYAPTVYYATKYLTRFGIKVRTARTCELLCQDYSDVALVLIETPSNPLMDVVDIKLLAEQVHAKGGLLAIDNTTCTGAIQKPLALGADIVACSDTKALNGHSDVLFGHVATNNDDLYQAFADWRKLSGSIAGPMETWLVQRSLGTLDIRLERMCANARVLAELLVKHPKVLSVRYPGLPDDPSYPVAKSQMRWFGFVISFDLGSQLKADKFLHLASAIIEATSFGGVHTMAERRARWGTDPVSQGLVRLSVGCEDKQQLCDLINDALGQL